MGRYKTVSHLIDLRNDLLTRRRCRPYQVNVECSCERKGRTGEIGKKKRGYQGNFPEPKPWQCGETEPILLNESHDFWAEYFSVNDAEYGNGCIVLRRERSRSNRLRQRKKRRSLRAWGRALGRRRGPGGPLAAKGRARRWRTRKPVRTGARPVTWVCSSGGTRQSLKATNGRTSDQLAPPTKHHNMPSSSSSSSPSSTSFPIRNNSSSSEAEELPFINDSGFVSGSIFLVRL